MPTRYRGSALPTPYQNEMLLRAMLLQAFYSVRSERQLMERLGFDPLFRWFVGDGSAALQDGGTIEISCHSTTVMTPSSAPA